MKRLFFFNSTAITLVPGFVYYLRISHTTVGTLSTGVHEVQCVHSNIDLLEKLHIVSLGRGSYITNATVTRIGRSAIYADTELVIENVIIDKLEPEAITVAASLIMKNVTIKEATSKSILLTRSTQKFLVEDVHVLVGSEDFIQDQKYSLFSVVNSTLGGQKIKRSNLVYGTTKEKEKSLEKNSTPVNALAKGTTLIKDTKGTINNKISMNNMNNNKEYITQLKSKDEKVNIMTPIKSPSEMVKISKQIRNEVENTEHVNRNEINITETNYTQKKIQNTIGTKEAVQDNSLTTNIPEVVQDSVMINDTNEVAYSAIIDSQELIREQEESKQHDHTTTIIALCSCAAAVIL